MIARTVIFNNETLVVLLAEPNTDDDTFVSVEEQCDTEIEAKRTGAEHRRPNRDGAVIGKITYDSYLEDGDWQSWRGVQRYVGSRRVACPVWPDVLAYADWATRVHDSKLVVGWNEGFTSLKIGTVDNLPTRAYLAPLVVGKLTLNDDEPIDSTTATVKVEVTHDAAFGKGIEGEVFTFNGTTSAATSKINYSVQGDNALDTTASYKIAETTKGVAIPNQTEPVTATASFSVAETTKGAAVTDQQESVELGAAFIVTETLQS